MPLDPSSVGSVSEPAEASWTSKDALLYALGTGAGQLDPTGFELEFTTENSQDIQQRLLPTFPVVIPVSGGGLSFGTFNMAMLVHGGQKVELFGELPPEGTVVGVGKVAAMYDKGSAAIVVLETEATYKYSGKLAYKTESSLFIRGEGGWGGDRGPSATSSAPPDRAPDHSVTYQTRHDQALLYRLSGDRNPLHSDPSFAKLAGFDTPILHGLCTYGFTGRALLHTFCGSDPAKFKSIEGRFSKPVLPGDALTVNMWVVGDGEALFQTTVGDAVVIDGGRCTFA